MRDDLLYLLRLWRDGNEPGAWRASLEDLRSHETLRFESLGALQRHLDEHAFRTAIATSPPEGSESEGDA